MSFLMKTPTRFRLRSLFKLVVLAALASEFLGWAIGVRNSPFFVGVACFAYGGIAGLLTFTCTATMLVTALRSPTGQKIGFVVGAALSTILWVICVMLSTYPWPPICVIFSALAVTLMVFLTRNELAIEESISPEHTLRRLQRAKVEILSSLNKKSTNDLRRTAHVREAESRSYSANPAELEN